jgi:calcineurin-like phosphoesterase family protein
MSIFIVSDTHFGHNKNFIFEPRGFTTVEEHDETIIQNWNSIVKPEDEVFHLGDVFLVDNEHGIKCLNRLNGHIHIIRGNHDSETRLELFKRSPNVVEVCDGKFFHFKKFHFFLSHFPCLTSNLDIDKPLFARTLNLCGHSHIQDPFADWDKGTIFHVEVDTNNCFPWNIEEIIELMKEHNH